MDPIIELDIPKVYPELIKKFRRLWRWYAKWTAGQIWKHRCYVQHIAVLHFLAFERYEREIEMRQIEVSKVMRYFALRQAALHHWRQVSQREIRKEMTKEFLNANKRLKEIKQEFVDVERWQKKKWLTEEEIRIKRDEIFYIVEKFYPLVGGRWDAQIRPFVYKAIRALAEWDWKTFDAVFLQLKKLPRRKFVFKKTQKGTAQLLKEVEWLEQEYENEREMRSPHKGLVMGMVPPLVDFQKWDLKDKKCLQKRQEKMFREIAALDKLIVAYKAMAECDVEMAKETCICKCQLSGTTHIEGIAEKTKALHGGSRIKLQRDPKNKYDKYAIAVLNEEDERIGWVPKQDNEILAQLMDAGKFLYSWVNKVETVTKSGYLDLSFYVFMYDI